MLKILSDYTHDFCVSLNSNPIAALGFLTASNNPAAASLLTIRVKPPPLTTIPTDIRAQVKIHQVTLPTWVGRCLFIDYLTSVSRWENASEAISSHPDQD
jgi:hypothetical protein